DNAFSIFDGEKDEADELVLGDEDLSISGVAYVFKKKKHENEKQKVKDGWLRKTFVENKKIIYSAIILSLFINIFALATPLFIMSTYDKVIGASSKLMLGEFLFGVSLAFAGYYSLYKIRAKLLAVVGARFDRAIGNNIFERLLYLPPIYTESASVGSQIARIKDFDRLRQFLTSPMVTTFFDLPFIFVGLAIIAIIGGNLVIIPFLMVLVFIILSLLIRMKLKRRIAQSGVAGSRFQEFILEAVKNVKTLKELTVERTWERRFREYSAELNLSTIRMSLLNGVAHAVADFMMIASGMAILAFGAIKVINQSMTVGGMIAVMILIWRVLAPLKTIFNSMPRLQQVESSIKQITRLMKIEPETKTKETLLLQKRHVKGLIQFHRVSFRYRAAYDPALMGVSFEIKPGQLVAVVGRNGSGKSTLLKILLGLYQPQAGSIRIDNQDIRQLDPSELRNMIGYLPQYPELFYGSIAANLRLAAPDATQAEIDQACAMAGILNEIKAMPEGFDTPIRDYSASKLPTSFRQSLCLARAYLKKARIILLDEPGNQLDREADQQLMRTLEYLRGKATVIMVTHRPSHLKMMDRVLLLEEGQLAIEGTPDEVLPKIPKEFL
ncbi:MAG: ATP-binding cassette domain-containing protein, partial [Coxiellaceae bacterium]|nr:ATP-binding cassette domain-containing protein [Coxiellaceae bacterium]